ncbi:hypothetical protein [Scrofimicrobium sp. R131]|uniref:Permease n=1 Tax=Scrofimicrobium appendicitidis TaxID=3079930 RepID=A0AAU7V4T4_9ACTO
MVNRMDAGWTMLGQRPPFRALLAVASFLAVLSMVVVPVIVATYEGRDERTLARATKEIEAPGEDKARFLFNYDRLILDHLDAALTYVEPLSDDAPLPPGVSEWMEPGEVVASPAVADDPHVEEALGPVVGRIGLDGLGSPREKLIYYRPPVGADTSLLLWGESFGNPFSLESASERINSQPPRYLMMLAVAFLIVPAFMLVVVAAQTVLSASRRRATELEIVGMAPLRAWRVTNREALRQLLAGGGGAALVVAAAMLINIPLLDYSVYAPDLVARWWYVLGGWAVGVAAVLTVFFLVTFSWRVDMATRPRPRGRKFAGWVALVGAMLIAFTASGAIQDAWAGLAGWSNWVVAGMLVTTVFIYPLCGWVTKAIASHAREYGRGRMSPTWLVFGAEASFRTDLAARSAALSALVIVIVTQMSLVSLFGSESAKEAENHFRLLDGKALDVNIGGFQPALPQLAAEFVEGLPEGTRAVLVEETAILTETDMTITPHLWITANDAAALGIDEDTTTWKGLTGTLSIILGADFYDGVRVHITETPFAGLEQSLERQREWEDRRLGPDTGPPIGEPFMTDRHLMVLADEGVILDRYAIVKATNQLSAPGWVTDLPGEEWRLGAQLKEHQTRWVHLFGVIGATVALAAVWVRTIEDMRESARRLAILFTVFGGAALAKQVQGMRIGFGALVGIGLGAPIAALYAMATIVLDVGVSSPLPLVAGLSILAGTAALAAWWASRKEITKVETQWKSGRTIQ